MIGSGKKELLDKEQKNKEHKLFTRKNCPILSLYHKNGTCQVDPKKYFFENF